MSDDQRRRFAHLLSRLLLATSLCLAAAGCGSFGGGSGLAPTGGLAGFPFGAGNSDGDLAEMVENDSFPKAAGNGVSASHFGVIKPSPVKPAGTK